MLVLKNSNEEEIATAPPPISCNKTGPSVVMTHRQEEESADHVQQRPNSLSIEPSFDHPAEASSEAVCAADQGNANQRDCSVPCVEVETSQSVGKLCFPL